MRDILQEAPDIAVIDQTGDSLCDIIEQAQGIPQKVHRPQDFGRLALQFLKVPKGKHI